MVTHTVEHVIGNGNAEELRQKLRQKIYDSIMYCANMCQYMYSVLSMHIDRQALTPLGDRGGTMGG